MAESMKTRRTARTGLGIIREWGVLQPPKRTFGEPFDYPGIQMFGWWVTSPPAAPSLLLAALSFWQPTDVELLSERDSAGEEDGSLHQNALYVKINRFPADDRTWKSSIERTLALFIEQGAAIAWAGDYTCMWHYHPTESMTACYAAYTTMTGLLCLSGLDEPLRFLDERPELVQRLHEASEVSRSR